MYYAERWRERQREIERQVCVVCVLCRETDRERETETDRERERETDREREIERGGMAVGRRGEGLDNGGPRRRPVNW